MNQYLHTLNQDLNTLTDQEHNQLIFDLESGKIIYLPRVAFPIPAQENFLLSPIILDPRSKNISYNYHKAHLSGVTSSHEAKPLLQSMMHRYTVFTIELIKTLFPHYQDALQIGRTSFRPAEIKGRKTSKRKDDTRLHVDSFAATPVKGLRILRVFCNINPHDEPRVWNVGEPFPEVLSQFAKHIPPYHRTRAKCLQLLRATKSLRTPYDHYMLKLHDHMKCDDVYQHSVAKHRIAFPAKSTWIVFTDQVSHAALSGQFLLEQTFYLPVEAMQQPSLSPLKQWEKTTCTALV